jgi:peptide/nickel transport system ATP-binding protein
MITMYAGRIVEQGPVGRVLSSPAHPYTAGLLAALPSPASRGHRLTTIPGRVPPPGAAVEGCLFAERCPHAAEECRQEPELTTYELDRQVRCVRATELDLEETLR